MSELDQYIITPDATIEEAMVAIEENRHHGLIVVDEENRVHGAISDGDIRKMMISHRLLTSRVRDAMKRNIIFVTEKSRSDAEQIFAKRSYIFLIPVVDSDMKLLDIIARGGAD